MTTTSDQLAGIASLLMHVNQLLAPNDPSCELVLRAHGCVSRALAISNGTWSGARPAPNLPEPSIAGFMRPAVQSLQIASFRCFRPVEARNLILEALSLSQVVLNSQ